MSSNVSKAKKTRCAATMAAQMTKNVKAHVDHKSSFLTPTVRAQRSIPRSDDSTSSRTFGTESSRYKGEVISLICSAKSDGAVKLFGSSGAGKDVNGSVLL